MESKEAAQGNSNNISTEDILKSLETFGNRSKSPEENRSKASNRDSGVSESCSSYFSDPLSTTSDAQSVLSDNERLSFASDTFSVVSDPLGVYASSDEGDNDIHYFSTEPWDERQSLEKEWNLLFSSKNFLQELRDHALNGKLKLSKYRSVAWKLFLDCLPEDQGEWITKTKQLRHEYSILKQKSLIDPSKSNDDDESLHILHPLSLEEESPWKQYFEDNELKAVINQDLDRLCPEMDFFHSPTIKEMMLDLLFCYAKKNESLGYKQGMHELLAPIIYVLDNDSKTHKYMEGDSLEIARCLVDPAFIEHDAFSMFSQLMEVTEAWYQQHKPIETSTNNKFIGQQAEPFTDPLASPPTAIVKKLNKIQDHLLRKYDPDLWIHMKELNIVPQVYGLRWIRLLFSREFPFEDVLVIWDALFAEGSHLDLVDYIYIVMLQTIRNQLMAGNYVTCMGLLMKFPRAYSEVYVYVKKALNLRGSKKSRPSSRGSPRTISPVPTIKESQRNISERGSFVTGKQNQKRTSHRRPQTTFSVLTKRYTPFMDSGRHRSIPNKGDQIESQPKTTELVPKSPSTPWTDILPPTTRDRTDSASSVGLNSARSMKSLGSDLKTKLTRPRSRSRHSVEELEKDHQRLQVQVSQLNNDVERMQGLYLYCGRKLDSYIGLIQEEITKEDEADRDVVYLSLAGLKQVRDLLKGTLSYRGTTAETEKDFVDIDNGIATRLQISSPNIRPDPTSDHGTPVPSLANFNHYENTNDKEPALLTSKSIDSNGDTNFIDSQNELQSENIMDNIALDSRGTCRGKVQCEEETPSKPDDTSNINVSRNQNDNGVKEISVLEESAKAGLLQTTEDHYGNETVAGSQKDVKGNVLEKSKVLSLDSYIKEHFDGDAQWKDPINIAAVPCAIGPKASASEDTIHALRPCTDDPLFLAEQNNGNFNFKKEKQHAAVQRKLDGDAREGSIDLMKGSRKANLKVEEGTANNMASDNSLLSTPDEPLDGFVFVNQDGTARSNHGSPVHPLENDEDSDRFI
ncbi:TBC1 domain family member 5-like isoform X2 [Actinia tenebrosa]|uniref:TBC1 domain family member 5-like isoform X2 n=1 Tax=Actinia tenebrosa TaxID=6105 RepID=A0A6P8I770_ACTTE|nr:TBC1 domain family member 5-like isoform X2 [Actinia tenebrosa]